MTAEEMLLDAGYDGVTYLTNYSYDDALIGVSSDGRAVYDFDRMVSWLMKEEGMTYEDAIEWIEYNTIRAITYIGSDAPIITYSLQNNTEVIPMQVRIKKLNNTASVPTFGSSDAAGCDLYANIEQDCGSITIAPGSTYFVKTGIAMEIPKNYAGFIYARSGLASKRGLRPANCVGVVDSDYRGEIMVALHNDSQVEQTINHGERVAQMVIAPYLRPEFVTVDELDDTDRGAGGFGHTGV